MGAPDPRIADAEWTKESSRPDAAVRVVRVVLPTYLRTLAGIAPGGSPRASGEVTLTLNLNLDPDTGSAALHSDAGEVTIRRVLDALESEYPALRGTVRDGTTSARRPFVRFFACEEDFSHESPDAALPDAVVSGREPFIVLGAIAGG